MDDTAAPCVHVSYDLVGPVAVGLAVLDIGRKQPAVGARLITLGAEVEQSLDRPPDKNRPHLQRRAPLRPVIDRERAVESLIVVKARNDWKRVAQPQKVFLAGSRADLMNRAYFDAWRSRRLWATASAYVHRIKRDGGENGHPDGASIWSRSIAATSNASTTGRQTDGALVPY